MSARIAVVLKGAMWHVYLDGQFISDHSTHTAARKLALVRDGEQ